MFWEQARDTLEQEGIIKYDGKWFFVNKNKFIAKINELGSIESRQTRLFEFIFYCRDVAKKFIAKVDDGRTKSKETYADMKELVDRFNKLDK